MGPAKRRPAKLTEFGKLLKELISDQGLLHGELALRVGVAPESLSRAMRGKPRPSKRLVLAIGTVLGLSDEKTEQLLSAAGYGRSWAAVDDDAYEAPFNALPSTHPPHPSATVLRELSTTLLRAVDLVNELIELTDETEEA